MFDLNPVIQVLLYVSLMVSQTNEIKLVIGLIYGTIIFAVVLAYDDWQKGEPSMLDVLMD